MQNRNFVNIIFLASLVTMGALVVWWATFIERSINSQREVNIESVRERTLSLAMILGHRQEAPTQEELESFGQYELVNHSDRADGDLSVPVMPSHPDLVIRPKLEMLNEVEDKFHRQIIMLYGEGSLFMIAVLLSIIMLYRSVIQERRFSDRLEKFVSIVTHELKTPVAGIKLLLQTIDSGKAPLEQLTDAVRMGLVHIQKQEQMISNILTAGRIDTGMAPERELQKIDIADFLRTYSEHRNVLHGEIGQSVLCECDNEEPLAAFADYHHLHTILDNLVDNAFKYGRKGEPTRITAERRGPAIIVSVIDSGIGFAPGESEKIFERFYRSSSPDDDMQHGAGLGLHISRQLAALMDGDLRANSNGINKGSIFTLTLVAVTE